ncbi:hypothetical protein KCU73_g159, partial [Aureobasidium melanogenum]
MKKQIGVLAVRMTRETCSLCTTRISRSQCGVQPSSKSVSEIEKRRLRHVPVLRHLPRLRHGNQGVSIDEDRNKVSYKSDRDENHPSSALMHLKTKTFDLNNFSSKGKQNSTSPAVEHFNKRV